MAEIKVQVVYVDDDKQFLQTITVPEGSSVREAIAASDLCEKLKIPFPDDDMVGIFSRRCSLDQVLEAGDRIEVYRPLVLDPMEIRRIRAQKALKPDL